MEYLKRQKQEHHKDGVISPVLANLFLHYVFDDFMSKEFPTIQWVRYADDGALNCVSLKQAKYIIKVLDKRFKLFGLELNLDKTKIVYCKDDNREKEYENIQFDFLGYTFRRRIARRNGAIFTGFLPAMSDKAQKTIKKEIRNWRLQDKTNKSLQEISVLINSKIQGWINYYAKYYKTEMYKILRYINYCLLKWVRRKFKNIHSRKQATKWLDRIAKRNTNIFSHWKFGVTPTAR